MTQPGHDDVLETVLRDLAAEGGELDDLVRGLTEAQWRLPTPAPGWDIATTVGHLAWTDEAAAAACAAADGDTRGWDALVREVVEDVEGVVDAAAARIGSASPTDLLQRWRQARTALTDDLRTVPDGVRLPWFGPPMSPVSMATARFMETWAHGLDVRAALGHEYTPTDRIRHVAHLGVRTRGFSFATNGLPAPQDEVRVELAAPSGATWAFGPPDAAQRVSGSAYDFCLLVTQRTHRLDTDLTAVGADADRWLDIAQCFAGPAGAGREPRDG